MQFRHQYPMARLLLPFILGILLAISLESSCFLLIPVHAIILIVIIVWVTLNPRNANYRNRWIFGLLVNLFLFMLGYNLLVANTEILIKKHFSHYHPSILLAKVDDIPREKERTWKLVLRIKALKEGNRFIPARGNLLCYLVKDSLLQVPEYGDLIIIHASPMPIPPPANPGTFNYKKYLEHNSIYHQVFLKKSTMRIIRKSDAFSIKGLSLKIRSYSMKVLENNNLNGKEYAIAAALLLGQDELLDYDTRHEYSSAGVVHILGISGLHIGILYLVLNFIFGFLDKYKKGRYLKIVVVLFVIWFYALITGLSPAALRSSAMFSFVSLGNLGKRNVHIFNSLATSAFVLLIIDPFLVSNIGFQFSYIAVAGIVLFHEHIYKLWESRYWLIDQAWSLTAMSIAAQLVTFPITLYYFHQFPTYFLPANLVVIPISNIVIYSGMAVLGTSFVPTLSKLLGLATYFLIKFINLFVHIIETLPYSVVKDIHLDQGGVLLLYLVIIFSAVSIQLRKRPFLFLALLIILVFFVRNDLENHQKQEQRKIIVYSVNKHSAIGFIGGLDCLLLADSAFLADSRLIDYNLTGSKAYFGIRKTIYKSIDEMKCDWPSANGTHVISRKSAHYIQSGTTRIAILTGKPEFDASTDRLSLDYLVICNNPRCKIKELLKLYNPKTVVFDGSNSVSRSKKWMDECKGLGISAYNSKLSGAFIKDL